MQRAGKLWAALDVGKKTEDKDANQGERILFYFILFLLFFFSEALGAAPGHSARQRLPRGHGGGAHDDRAAALAERPAQPSIHRARRSVALLCRLPTVPLVSLSPPGLLLPKCVFRSAEQTRLAEGYGRCLLWGSLW